MSLEPRGSTTLEADAREDERFERRVFWREVAIALAVVALLIVRALVL